MISASADASGFATSSFRDSHGLISKSAWSRHESTQSSHVTTSKLTHGMPFRLSTYIHTHGWLGIPTASHSLAVNVPCNFGAVIYVKNILIASSPRDYYTPCHNRRYHNNRRMCFPLDPCMLMSCICAARTSIQILQRSITLGQFVCQNV